MWGGYKYLINCVLQQYNSDIIEFNVKIIDKSTSKADSNPGHHACGVTHYATADKYISAHKRFMQWVWCNLYRREFLRNNNLAFGNFNVSEDIFFNLECLRCNPHITHTDAALYRYYVHSGSAVTRYDRPHLRRAIDGFIAIYKLTAQYAEADKKWRAEYANLLTSWQYLIVTRMLSGAFSVGELKGMRQRLQCEGIMPLHGSRFLIISQFMLRHIRLFHICNIGYRYVFLPYIKPIIRRY